jgi:hypothetical protein
MLGMIAPGLVRFLRFEFDDRNPLAVGRREILERDEAGHGFGQFQHL